MENKETIMKLYEKYADEIYTMTDEKMEISKKIQEQEEKLYKTLTEEQVTMLNVLQEYDNKKKELVNKQTFVYAFSLATKLFIEGTQDSKK